jgi:hypothetical protein
MCAVALGRKESESISSFGLGSNLHPQKVDNLRIRCVGLPTRSTVYSTSRTVEGKQHPIHRERESPKGVSCYDDDESFDYPLIKKDCLKCQILSGNFF